MLIEKFRSASGKWWFKVLMGMLAVIFALLWYGVDLANIRIGRDSTAATVGNEKISIMKVYQEARRLLALRQNIENTEIDMKKEAGHLTLAALQHLIQQSLLSQELARLSFTVSDTFIRDEILKMKAFQTADGKFNKEAFLHVLAQNNMTEASFVESLRQEKAQQRFLEALVADVHIPQSAATRLYAFDTQKRQISLVTITPANIKIDRQPTDQDLRTFYVEHDRLFHAPEYRDISALLMEKEAVLKSIALSEDEVKKGYEARKEDLGVGYPEAKAKLLEELRQQKAAEYLYDLSIKIDDAIGGGATLEEVAQKYHFKIVRYQRVTKKGVQDDARETKLDALPRLTDLDLQIIEMAFGQKEGNPGTMVEAGEGKYFIARADRVYPSHKRPFEKIKTKVTELWRESKQNKAAVDLAKEMLKDVTAGDLLPVLAAKNNLKVASIRVSRRGTMVPTLSLPPELMAQIYAAPLGQGGIAPRVNDQGKADILLAIVTKIEPVTLKGAEETIEKFKQGLSGVLGADLGEGLLNSIRKRYPVSENKSAVEQVAAALMTEGTPKSAKKRR